MRRAFLLLCLVSGYHALSAAALGAVPAFDTTFGQGGVLGTGSSDAIGQPVFMPDGTTLMRSARRVVRIAPDGRILSSCSPAQDTRVVGLLRNGQALVELSAPSGASELRRVNADCVIDATVIGSVATPQQETVVSAQEDVDGTLLVQTITALGGAFYESRLERVGADGSTTVLRRSGGTGGQSVLSIGPSRVITLLLTGTDGSGPCPSCGAPFTALIRIDAAGNELANGELVVRYFRAESAMVDSAGVVWLAGDPGSGAHVIVRLRADGTPDPLFGVAGSVSAPGRTRGMLMQTDGRVVVAATAQGSLPYGDMVLMRLLPNGELDTSFGDGGIAALPDLWPLTITPDNKLLLTSITSASTEQALARVTLGPATLVEYYHQGLDHYFMTSNAAEARDLDVGFHQGWARTGLSFDAWGSEDMASPGDAPVCRYYIEPDFGDSHFFSASAEECAAIAHQIQDSQGHAAFVRESSAAFYVALPDPETGACAPDRVPIYRLWNDRTDSNHRYTANPFVRDAMVARGYVAEGYGIGVAMCSLPARGVLLRDRCMTCEAAHE